MQTSTIGELLQAAAVELSQSGSPSARLDAELLLTKALSADRTQLYVQSDRQVDEETAGHYRSLVARRVAHEPVAYILGQAHFRKLRLTVEPAVLIPRPETEELVEVALEVLRRRPAWQGAHMDAPLVADVGTGSGAIALSLAQEAGLAVLATDISAEALRVAAANAAATGLERLVELRCADLLEGVPDACLHLVVGNPPYVASGDYVALAPDIRLYEPVGALDAGPDGLDVIRRLLPGAARALRPGGTVLLEVGYDQASSVCDLALQTGFAFTTVHKDLSGKERIVEATLPGACAMGMKASAEAAAPRSAPHTAPDPAAHAAPPPALHVANGPAQVEVPGIASRGALESAPPARSAADPWTAQLRAALAAGAIIGVPTDTVYGIAARWDTASGIERLFVAKGRPVRQPVQVLFPSVDAIVWALPDLASEAAAVLAGLLPGPYTFVVATTVARPDQVGTPDSLGVRVPDFTQLLRLLDMVGAPLAATSANLSGRPDARTLGAVDPLVLAHCSVAFDPSLSQDGGTCEAPAADTPQHPVDVTPVRASTVVDLRPLARGESPVVLREGAVSTVEVLERIGALV